MDISDFDGLADIKENYLTICENLKFIPTEGTYSVPYVANAAGILYNRDMFEEHGWEIPETWDELLALCDEIEAEGILPFYMGYKDTWTCLSPWNSAVRTYAGNLKETSFLFPTLWHHILLSYQFRCLTLSNPPFFTFDKTF